MERWSLKSSAAVVLQRDVRDVGSGEEAARVRADELVVAGGDVRVDHPRCRRPRLDRVHVGRADEELAAGRTRTGGRVGRAREQAFERGHERADAVQRRAVLDPRDPDVPGDLRRTTEVLDVVVGHRGALGVPHDVDLVRAGSREHLVDEGGELRRALLHRGQPAEFVERCGPAVPVREREHAVAVVREQRGHRLPVVGHVGEQPVDEHDRVGVRGAGLAGPVVRAGRRGSGLERGRGDVRREGVRDRVLRAARPPPAARPPSRSP